jgi:hypothetical protein
MATIDDNQRARLAEEIHQLSWAAFGADWEVAAEAVPH